MMIWTQKRHGSLGISLLEVVVVFLIIGTMATIFIASISSSKTGDSIDRGTQSIYDDLVFIRSRSLSANTEHRISFSSPTSWRLQAYDEGATTWNNVGEPRFMPTDTFLTSAAFANAASNLEASPRGLFVFQGGSNGSPYITVTGLAAPKTKSLYVYVGGAIEIRIP